ncbi:unnamed protein product [Trifolium pratense]|uniref:Uncharacterized protein n=1 Tax=Trifolium pratense TaxID=57577 RepID=A0ACB0KW05_TRIPR|nr:unnamed protein product [Trifolium pratense]
MNIVSWNCRGVGHPRVVPGLKYLVRVYKPDVLFLSETLSNTRRMEELRHLLGFDSCFAVNREGRGGGLAFMWRSSFHCSVTNFSSNHVDVEVADAVNGNWRLTGIYGFPGSGRRRDSWNFLKQLSQISSLPWCVLGDFNDILSPSEKKGRNDRAPWLINGFRSAVLESGLADVHMEGYPFTWFKSLGTFRAVEERLDRALANDAWFHKFPNAVLEILPAPASDHYPILLVREPESRTRRARSRFKFENAWLVEPKFNDFVSNRWVSYGDNQILQKLDMCASDLSSWNRNYFKRLQRDIDTCRKRIDHDCFLFFRANINEAEAMKNILNTYEAASGQSLNFQKSEIFCSRNVSGDIQNSVATCLGVHAVLGTGKYLGLPSMIGRSKKSIFSFIKDIVWKKINSWSSKTLSKAEREVLIKYVLQSIPTYFMSIFTIPSSLCDEIEKMMNSFWWGHSGVRNKGIHWMSWEKLSMHKSDGGMGFKSLPAFNLAMLGKQGWRVMSNPNILISKIYKARYFPHCDFFDSKVGHNPSFVWRSICNSKFILKAGSRWRIGSGKDIPLLNENWLYDASAVSLQQTNVLLDARLTVADIIIHDEKCWNMPLITSIFEPNCVTKILDTPLYKSVVDDMRIWRVEKNGMYSVRSAYRLCVQELLDTSHLKVNGAWVLLWKIKVPPRVKNLLWRICRRCIPTRVNLRSRGVNCIDTCPLCNEHEEDSYHIFFDCPSSRNVWSMCTFYPIIVAAMQNGYDAAELIFHLLQQINEEDASLLACVIWSIWKQRNNIIWNNVTDAQNFVFSRANITLHDWRVVHTARTGVKNQQVRHESRWKKPSSGRMKCNIDASFSSLNNRVGIGVCIRDEFGAYVLAKYEQLGSRVKLRTS